MSDILHMPDILQTTAANDMTAKEKEKTEEVAPTVTAADAVLMPPPSLSSLSRGETETAKTHKCRNKPLTYRRTMNRHSECCKKRCKSSDEKEPLLKNRHNKCYVRKCCNPLTRAETNNTFSCSNSH